MSQLQQLQTNVDSQVAELLSAGVSHNQILVTFEMKLERAQALLRQVNNAKNMSHGIRAGLLTEQQASALVSAIDYILVNSNDLINDLNNINGSGVHEVDEPTRYRLIVGSILEVADQRYVNETFWRIAKNKFKKINYFSDLFNSVPKAKEDEANTYSTLVEIHRPEFENQAS